MNFRTCWISQGYETLTRGQIMTGTDAIAWVGRMICNHPGHVYWIEPHVNQHPDMIDNSRPTTAISYEYEKLLKLTKEEKP